MITIIIMVIMGNWLTSLGVDNFKNSEVQEEVELFFKIYQYISIVLSGIFVPIFSVLLSSFIHWVIAKITRSKVSFKQLFSMNTYITFITALGILVNGLYYFYFSDGTGEMFTSMGSIVESNGAFGEIFNSIELFAIWTLILTGIGLHKVAEFPKWLAWAVPMCSFMLGVITTIIGASFTEMVGV